MHKSIEGDPQQMLSSILASLPPQAHENARLHFEKVHLSYMQEVKSMIDTDEDMAKETVVET
jgi:hypothetical protein